MREVKKLATLMVADAAAELVGSGDWVDYGFAPCAAGSVR
jgi:hypothetical protein